MMRLPIGCGVLGRYLKGGLGIWLALVCVFLATLVGNGYPIIDHDSQRYLPTLIGSAPFSLSPQRASIVPLLLNEVPFRIFGIWGIPIVTSLVMAWALTRLLQELAYHFVTESRRLRFCLVGVLVLALFSFLPVIAISILSEPWSVIAFSVAWTTLLSRKVSLASAVVLLISAASHSTNVMIIGVAALFAIALSRAVRESIKLSLLVVGILISGSLIDRGLFTLIEGDSPRMRYSYVGGALLNFYPRVYEDFCDQSPGSLLCEERLREYVTRNRSPFDYFKSRFLWTPTKICRDLPGASSLPNEVMISLEDYERESLAMSAFVARRPVTYGPYVMQVALEKSWALFMANDLYSHPYNLTIESVRAPWANSLAVAVLNKNPARMLVCSLVKLLALGCLALALSGVWIRRNSSTLSQKQREVIALGLMMYILNLLIYGSIEAALSRYHYRAYFILPLLAYALAWALWAREAARRD